MSRYVAIALLASATSLFGQASPTSIVGISRDQGSVAGGDVVLLHLLNPPYCDPIGCILNVSFGDVPARSTELASGDMLRVITPAHAPGRTDVTLSVNGAVAATSPYTFRFAGMREIAAPDSWNYEIVLLPLAVGSEKPVAGAFGSQWTTEIWVSNSGDNDVELFNGYPTSSGSTGERFPFIAAHTSKRINVPADVTSAGYLFYVQKGGAENVHFSLRVRDVSRSAENAGTELPVARVTGFQVIPSATILNVPVEDVSRTSLRTYGDGAQPVHLRIFSMPDDGALVDQDVPVAPADLKPYDNSHGFPARSEYARIGDLQAAFPQLTAGRYRIEVTSTGNWIWALATVTNNETQLVTAIASSPVQRYGDVRQ